MSDWSSGKILSLIDSELLLGTMFASCVWTLHVPQRLVCIDSTRWICLVVWLDYHILDLCVTMNIDVALHLRIVGRLLLLQRNLIDLYLPWLTTCYRWFASRNIDLLHLVRSIRPCIIPNVRLFHNKLTFASENLVGSSTFRSFILWFKVAFDHGYLVVVWLTLPSSTALVALIRHVL